MANDAGRRGGESSTAVPEDAPTPIISNRAMMAAQRIPPPISLPAAPSLGNRIETPSLIARFSSEEGEPILMTPVSSGLQRIQETTSTPQKKQRNLKENQKQNKLASWQVPFDILPLTTLNDSSSPVGTIGSAFVLIVQAAMWRLMRSLRSLPLHGLPENQIRSPLLTGVSLIRHQQQFEETMHHDQAVRGIPNFGQTCFINSVLQALASLEPFMVYLERLVELNQERHDFAKWEGAATANDKSKHAAVSGDSLSICLLSLLRGVNGASHENFPLDTRPLLHMIARNNPQFRSKHGRNSVGKEQQDAEEFLQATVGAIVDEAEFHLLPSSVPSAFVTSLSNLRQEDMDDEVLTLASSLHEGRCGGQAVCELSTQPVPSTVATDKPSSFAMKKVGPSSAGSLESLSESYPTSQREEKKQEDFEVHVPRVCSEENMLIGVPIAQVEATSLSDSDSLSDMSSKEKRLSAAMQIMMSTTSSLSPSPFCFWMGSSLQCRACRNVRPIQNSPLLDIPVVPTAVSNYLSPSSMSRSHSAPPQKFAPSSAFPSCRLEECLQEFTAVERVQDVECRCCTLRRKRVELEEDVAMYHDALTSSFAMKEKTDSRHLRLALQQAQSRLKLISSISIDDDDANDDTALLEKTFEADDGLGSEEGQFKMERHDSYKCLLLTRLPAVLTLHVQRRFYDPVRNCMTKTIQHVDFPELLDVAPFCASGGPLDERVERAESFSKGKASIHYRLMAVIEHRGDAFLGHYVCYRRDVSADRWLFVSDQKVKPVDWSTVRRSQAYMLFYEAI